MFSRISVAAVAIALAVTACGDGAVTTTTNTTTTVPPSVATTPATTPASAPPTATSTPTTTSATTTTTQPAVPTIEVTIRDGIVAGGGRHEVTLGSEIRIVVDSDVADEIHVHGYDVLADVVPGTPAVLEFTADIPGIFEVELESAHTEILELEVAP
jgi:heme/copper-type cytochrome/quinol oxidase subunit 2